MNYLKKNAKEEEEEEEEEEERLFKELEIETFNLLNNNEGNDKLEELTQYYVNELNCIELLPEGDFNELKEFINSNDDFKDIDNCDANHLKEMDFKKHQFELVNYYKLRIQKIDKRRFQNENYLNQNEREHLNEHLELKNNYFNDILQDLIQYDEVKNEPEFNIKNRSDYNTFRALKTLTIDGQVIKEGSIWTFPYLLIRDELIKGNICLV